MRTASLERMTAITGLAVVILFVAGGFLLPMGAPASDDPSAAFGAYYAQHRTALLVVLYGGVLGAALVLAFLAGLRDLLRRLDERGESTLATIGLLAGTVSFAAVAVGLSILAGAVYRVGQSPEALRSVSDVGWSVVNLGAGLPTTVSLVAFSIVIHRSRALPGWVVAVGVLVAGAHMVVSAAFAQSGFLSPQGEVSLVVPALYYLWVLVVSLTLLRRRTPETAT